MDDYRWLIEFALGVGLVLLGGYVGRVTKRLDDLTAADVKLTETVHNLALVVAGLQQYQADTAQFRTEVRDQLRYIVERLDGKEKT